MIKIWLHLLKKNLLKQRVRKANQKVNLKYFLYHMILMMKRMLLQKLEEPLVGMKVIFLRVIYLICIVNMLRIMDGKQRYLMLLLVPLEDIHKQSLWLRVIVFILNLNTKVVLIEYREYLLQRVRVEYILVLLLYLLCQRLKSLILNLMSLKLELI